MAQSGGCPQEALGTGSDTAAHCTLCLTHQTEDLAWPGTQKEALATHAPKVAKGSVEIKPPDFMTMVDTTQAQNCSFQQLLDFWPKKSYMGCVHDSSLSTEKKTESYMNKRAQRLRAVWLRRPAWSPFSVGIPHFLAHPPTFNTHTHTHTHTHNPTQTPRRTQLYLWLVIGQLFPVHQVQDVEGPLRLQVQAVQYTHVCNSKSTVRLARGGKLHSFSLRTSDYSPDMWRVTPESQCQLFHHPHTKFLSICWLCCPYQAMLVVLPLSSYAGCAAPIKLCWLCCPYQAILVVLPLSSYTGCAAPIKLCWLCCPYQAMLVVLRIVPNYAGCATPIKLCWLCCPYQAMLVVLPLSSYAGCATPIKLCWLCCPYQAMLPPIKLCWLCCPYQAMLVVLPIVPNYAGCATPIKLCWLCYPYQAMLVVLPLSSYAGCATPIKLCWLCYPYQAMLVVLPLSSYAGCAAHTTLCWLCCPYHTMLVVLPWFCCPYEATFSTLWCPKWVKRQKQQLNRKMEQEKHRL